MLRQRMRHGILILLLSLMSTTALADAQTAIQPYFVASRESLAEMNAQLDVLQNPMWYSMSPSQQKDLIRFSLYKMTRSQRNEAIWRGLHEYDVGWQTLSLDTRRNILMDVLSYRILTTEQNPTAR